MQQSGKGPGRRGYPADFRQRALSQLASGESSLRAVAKELDISVPTLIKWRKEVSAAGQRRAPAQAPRTERDLTMELERLREEVEQLKQERDRLRQGIAILAGISGKIIP